MEFVRWLQSSELVVSFQRYFGVENLDYPDLQPPNLQKQKEAEETSEAVVSEVHAITGPGVGSTASLCDKLLGPSMVGTGEISTNESSPHASYIIHNWFWYHFFALATLTGDEIFYTLFFPFWLWNVDGAVMRRVIVCWMVTMYIGQALKDWLSVPRPQSPPVVRLGTKWVLEYGLPSTHATVSLVLPSALLIFSVERYQMSWESCAVVVGLWCLSVSISRIYLGMHSLLDVVCGLLLGLVLLVLLVPVLNALDDMILSRPDSPLLVFGLTVAAVAAYPATATWNPARGDTAVILGVGCGTLIGAWFNYQANVIARPPSLSHAPLAVAPPSVDHRYPILWPSWGMALLAVVRTALGLLLLVLVRCTVSSVAMKLLCGVMQVDIEDYRNHNSVAKQGATVPPPQSGAQVATASKQSCPSEQEAGQSSVSETSTTDEVPAENSFSQKGRTVEGGCPQVGGSSTGGESPQVGGVSTEPGFSQVGGASPQEGVAWTGEGSPQRRPLTRVQHCFIECGYKLITYICIGLLISAVGPAVFRIIGIERPTFCTEV